MPTENGATADHEIKAINSENDLMWPWEVWSDGKKLITTSTEVGQVAFWDDVESAIDGMYADRVIQTGGTPRTVISDGDYLLIGDHNIGRRDDRNGDGFHGSHVWLHYPTEERQPDFVSDLSVYGEVYSDTHINRDGFYPEFEIVKDAMLLPNGQFIAADQNMRGRSKHGVSGV